MSDIEGNLPPNGMPVIWGDYNAIGLSGEKDDNCIYSLNRERISGLAPVKGMKIFVYENDIDENGKSEIFGFVCTLEKVEWAVSSWRARPDENT